MKNLYLLALATTLVFAGCKKDDPDSPPQPEPEPELELTVEQTDYTLGAIEERTATVAFTAPAEWTLSVVYDETETDADTEWLTVTPASGAAGEQEVRLTARLNLDETSRTAYVDLVCGEETVRLTVIQAAASDETNFSALFAPGFAQVLQEKGHISDAGNITLNDLEKIAAITELDVSRSSLTSLQGIEYFESLMTLKCYSNSLTELNVSNNTELTRLWCNENQLTELDVNNNTKLEILYCDTNKLETLDVSNNTELEDLQCSENQLTKLDVSKNTELEGLQCYENQLTKLDLSKNTALTSLYCSSNQLTSLDISNNTKLTTLNCSYNSLASLDVSKNTELMWLECDSNQLTSLDVSGCAALTWLECSSNQLKSLDVSQNTALTTLCYGGNPGDGESKFPVTAWFDSTAVPADLYIPSMSWTYEDKTIAIDFQKAEPL